jgi:hypothetical protein
MRKPLLLVPLLFLSAFAVGNFHGSAPAKAQIVIGPELPGAAACPGGGKPNCAQCWGSACVDACKLAYYCDIDSRTKTCKNVGTTCGHKKGGIF